LKQFTTDQRQGNETEKRATGAAEPNDNILVHDNVIHCP